MGDNQMRAVGPGQMERVGAGYASKGCVTLGVSFVSSGVALVVKWGDLSLFRSQRRMPLPQGYAVTETETKCSVFDFTRFNIKSSMLRSVVASYRLFGYAVFVVSVRDFPKRPSRCVSVNANE